MVYTYKVKEGKNKKLLACRVRYATACHISGYYGQADTIRNVSPAKLNQMYLIAKKKMKNV